MCAEQIKQKDMIIVAMKGHPGSGKSTLATSIATALQIPLLDKDDVRDSTLSLQRSLLLLLSTSPPAAASSLLNDLSYHAIWQIASTQLRLGLSVVVDSPLSRRTHLDRLLELASARGARVLVVECKPADQAEWRRRLELRGRAAAPGTGGGWHKPATWSDVERLLEGYGGCTDYDVGDVPRLVVDTTARVEAQELVSGVLEFICSHCGPSSQPTPQ